jgi:di/tricarboxylate transporter
MTLDIALTLGIILLAVVLFVKEAFSIDTVSILIMVLFMVTGILTPSEGFAGFNNSATITVGAMFVLSASIYKTGALNGAALLLIKAGKINNTFALLAIMLVAGVLSAFINDTAVVALLMPITIEVARKTGISPSKLLMPLSFGALMGGVCTLVGTSTNILVSGIAEKHGLASIGMFEMSGAGIWFLGVGVVYMLVAGRYLMPDRKASESLSEDYEMNKYLADVQLLPTSKLVGKVVNNTELIKEVDLELLNIVRGGEVLEVYEYSLLKAHDILKVRCDVDKLKQLETREGIVIVKTGESTKKNPKKDSKLVEVMIRPNSVFESKVLTHIRFRMVLSGAPVLAIRSRKGILHSRLTETPLRAGDIILVRANENQLRSIRQNKELLIISESEEKKADFKRIIPTLIVAAGVITTAAMGWAPIVLSACVGVLVLIGLRFISPEEAYEAIEWKVIFMLAGVLSMGMALEKTGAAALLARFINDTAGSLGPHVVLSMFFFITFMATNVMSNNASAALLAPVAIVTAQAMEVSERPFLMAVTFAASLSFMTPMGYQTNTMIYGPGNYRFVDFLRVGTPLNIILWIVASLIIPLYFPF